MTDTKLIRRTIRMTSDNRKNILDFLNETNPELYKRNFSLFLKLKVLDLLLLGAAKEEAEKLFLEIIDELENKVRKLKEEECPDFEIVELEYLMIILIRTMNSVRNFEKYGEAFSLKRSYKHRDIRKLKEYYEMMNISIEQQIKNCVLASEKMKNFALRNKLINIKEKLKDVKPGDAVFSQKLNELGTEYTDTVLLTGTQKQCFQYICFELATLDIRINHDFL